MRSYILQLRAQDETILPASNGYLLFSLFCALVRDSDLDSVFHPDAQDGEQAVSVRVSLVRDADGARFEALLRPREGTAVRLGTASFILDRLLCPGEDEMALSLSSTQLIPSAPMDSVGLRFVSPTGFKRDGRQFFLPLPDLVFGSLLRRWRLLFDPDSWPGFEEALPRITLQNYRAESRAVKLRQDRIIRGFCGEAEFALPGADGPERTALSALAGLAFFTGVGYKTTQGMGEVWPFWRR